MGLFLLSGTGCPERKKGKYLSLDMQHSLLVRTRAFCAEVQCIRRTSSWFYASVFSCTHHTLRLTLKDQATLIFLIRLSLGKPEMSHERPTRVTVGHFSSTQMELSSCPKSFPFLIVGTVQASFWWGIEPHLKQDVKNRVRVLCSLCSASKKEMRLLPGIV